MHKATNLFVQKQYVLSWYLHALVFIINDFFCFFLFCLDDAVLKAERELPYEIIHYGSETETYIATITSSKSSFLLKPSSRQHIVTAEDHVTGVFKLKPTIPSVIL